MAKSLAKLYYTIKASNCDIKKKKFAQISRFKHEKRAHT